MCCICQITRAIHHALRLKTSAAGHEVTEVIVDRNGVSETYRGNLVVVSAGAANSARLLLMSANDQHPCGLANGSDQVGLTQGILPPGDRPVNAVVRSALTTALGGIRVRGHIEILQFLTSR